MNLLYISHLTGSPVCGPTYSVPAQVGAQAEYDNIYWWNLTEPVLESWQETGVFHNRKDQPELKIAALPAPFDKPDLVIFEDFYYIDDYRLSRECVARKIPYVIVPRSALTKKAQSEKKLKKTVANTLFFLPMTRNAAAIQYLTESEQQNSGKQWCKRSFVAPNGVATREFMDKPVESGKLHGVYIGRFSPQKGLDLLIEAVETEKTLLRNAGLTISMYGPTNAPLWHEVKQIVEEKNLGDILSVYPAAFEEEKHRILSGADFFIMTSRFEGMPMGMIEALGFSLPCLATEGTNLADEIRHYDAGWTCDNNAESIVSALKALCGSVDKLGTYRQNAHRLSLAYSWKAIAERTHKEYLTLLEKA